MTTVPTAPTRERSAPDIQRPGVVGTTTVRADGIPKVKGEFEYSSDMRVDGMLWGATLRSAHPRADIWSIDISRALAIPGVRAVLTHEDVPGQKLYGMERADQPVLAWQHVRYQGEPIAIVAADHPETARRAIAAIEVEYDVLEPLTDPERAMAPGAPELHLSGNVLRHVRIIHGDPDADADVVVAGEYEVGMQDQAFLGPESGLAVPDGEGGVDLYIATQWLHVDRGQIALSLDLPPEKVRLIAERRRRGVRRPRGSLDADPRLPARAAHRPAGQDGLQPRGVVLRPCPPPPVPDALRARRHRRRQARLRARADRARRRRLCLELDGRVLERRVLRRRPVRRPQRAHRLVRDLHQQPAVRRDARVRRRPGRVAHEAQMDKLAAALGIDPVELRIANAMRPGTRMPTGQVVREPAPVAELLERVRAMPLPPVPDDGGRDPRELPGGVSNTTHGEGVRRGVGYAVGIKNVGFSEGFDDYSTARVRLSVDAGEPLVEVHTAAVEVGQGLVTVQAQIAQDRAGRRARRRANGRHPGGFGGVKLGVASDVRDRRRGQGRVRGGPGATAG